MKLNRIGDTCAELHFEGLPQGSVSLVVLFSYQTPVAARLSNGDAIRTAYKHSVTTSRHISQFLQGVAHNQPVREMPQSFFDQLMDGGETTC